MQTILDQSPEAQVCPGRVDGRSGHAGRKCCFVPDPEHHGITCLKDAEFKITPVGGPCSDFTEGCREHVGALLSDRYEHVVTRIATR